MRRARVGLGAVLVALAVASGAPAARAVETDRAVATPAARAPDPFAERGGYVRLFGSAMIGDGLRFNNPYRLAHPLGGDAESVARTAAYADFGFGVAFGRAQGLQHAGVLRTTLAIEGISQGMLTPSYVLWRRFRSLAAYGRVGVPIVLTPNVNVGGEAAAGGVWFFRGGIGLCGELVGDLFYGAGTREVSRPAYPLLGAQIGVQIDYEVLP